MYITLHKHNRRGMQFVELQPVGQKNRLHEFGPQLLSVAPGSRQRVCRSDKFFFSKAHFTVVFKRRFHFDQTDFSLQVTIPLHLSKPP
jgi:hypothetical protein